MADLLLAHATTAALLEELGRRGAAPACSCQRQPAQRWPLVIPAPCDWANSNQRQHWAARARLVKQWRAETVNRARAAGLPTGLGRVRIDVLLRFTSRHRRDALNYEPTIKGVIDGLCRDKTRIDKHGKEIHAPGYGLIWDDEPTYLDGPFPRIGDPVDGERYPRGVMQLLITSLEETA